MKSSDKCLATLVTGVTWKPALSRCSAHNSFHHWCKMEAMSVKMIDA